MNHAARAVLLLMLAGMIPAAVGCFGGTDPSPATAQGTVLGAANLEPVAGATVNIETSVTTTDGSGHFSLDTRSGRRTLLIDADGYEQTQLNVRLSSGVNNLGSIYIAPALQENMGAVEGIVVDAQEQPVPGARVSYGNLEAVSREDGTFALYNLNPGTQVIVAVSGNDVGWTGVEVVAGETTTGVTISLGQTPPGPPPGFD